MAISEYPVGAVKQFFAEEDGLTAPDNKIQPPMYDAVSMDSVWGCHLTHQMRVLLYTEPLLRVLRSDEYRSEELEHYDSLALALKLFDYIVTHTGLEHEASSDTAMRNLLPIMDMMDQAAGIVPDVERQMRMAKIVLSALRNDKEGTRPFKRVYTDLATGHAVKRELAIRLIEERHTVHGDIVLHLSNEATNLLLHALAYDIEDAQAAAEAIVQSQLARGHLQDAINSAQVARWQSSRLRKKIEQLLAATRRDLSRVDWRQDIPRILEEALIHLKGRCEVEHNIIDSARKKQENLEPSSEEAYHLTTLISIIGDCRQCHMELQQQLMEAPQIFLDEQARQIFALRRCLDLPDMGTDVLEPLFGMRCVLAKQALDTIFASSLGVRAPSAFSLTQYMLRLLRPRREPRPETVPVIERELIAVSNDRLRYTRDVYERAEIYLNTLHYPVRLAYLLQQAIDAGESESTLEVILFSVLRHFDPLDIDDPTFQTIKRDNEQFSIGNFYGDNVLICSYEEIRKNE
ncbi:MAG TPA: hypothetical protein VGL94_03775 [Ktedonobacteraceae bacterium]